MNFVTQSITYVYSGKMYLNWMILIPHVLLHASSLIFKVLPRRRVQRHMAMFIWEELRLHAAVFAMRAILVILILDKKFAKLVVLGTMLAADLVTKKYGTEGVSTVRGLHSAKTKSTFKILSGLFFSTSQLAATLICSGCFCYEISPVLVFCTLPPIQTSAFGMTLIRKNMITKRTWSYVYGVELSAVGLMWWYEYANLWVIPLAFLAFGLRKLMNKYAVWIFIFIADIIWTQAINT